MVLSDDTELGSVYVLVDFHEAHRFIVPDEPLDGRIYGLALGLHPNSLARGVDVREPPATAREHSYKSIESNEFLLFIVPLRNLRIQLEIGFPVLVGLIPGRFPTVFGF